ncbi:hypothetical protein ABTL72_19160, partial [Acinetobacter baumannii]
MDSVAQWKVDAFALDSAVRPYTVTAVPRVDVDSLSRVGGGADKTDPQFTQLDATTTQRTRDLARTITAGVT